MKSFRESPTWTKRIVVVGLVVGFFGALPACATIFNGGDQDLNFDSQPPEATVLVNGQAMGQTPVELDLDPSKSYTVTFRREGCEDITKQLTTHVGGGWVVLDIFAGLIGVAVDAATGNWKSFDDRQHYAELDCDGEMSARDLVTPSYTF